MSELGITERLVLHHRNSPRDPQTLAKWMQILKHPIYLFVKECGAGRSTVSDILHSFIIAFLGLEWGMSFIQAQDVGRLSK